MIQTKKNKKIPLYFPPINKLGNIAFRKVCKTGGADFVFTELINGEKLLNNEQYQINKLKIPKNMEKTTIIQIVCENIENIDKTIQKILKIQPNIKEINYNMGCPQSTMAKNETGGGIIKNPKKIKKVANLLYKACKKHNIKPSIKIRIGIDRKNLNIKENIQNIKLEKITKIYIHGRCLLDGYQKPATYQEIGEIKKLHPELQIIANGDVKNHQTYTKIIQETNCDGILIGRAALENPYIFNQLKTGSHKIENSGTQLKSKLPIIIELLKHGKKENLTLDYLKQNIVWLTKCTIGGPAFRKKFNDISDFDKMLNYCKTLK